MLIPNKVTREDVLRWIEKQEDDPMDWLVDTVVEIANGVYKPKDLLLDIHLSNNEETYGHITG